jgi:hypothetical protein
MDTPLTRSLAGGLSAADRLGAERRPSHVWRQVGVLTLRHPPPLGAHHLIATREVAERRAPDVDQAGERENEKDGEAKEHVQLEDQRHVRDLCGLAGPEGYDALHVAHEVDHHRPVEVAERQRNRQQA